MKRKLLLSSIALLVATMLAIPFLFTLVQMNSTSMAPLIHGESKPNAQDGDYLLIVKGHRREPKVGDLVLVRLKALNGTRTIRKIGGMHLLNGEKRYFLQDASTYLQAGSNALDSDDFGPVPIEEVEGRVVHIFHFHQ